MNWPELVLPTIRPRTEARPRSEISLFKPELSLTGRIRPWLRLSPRRPT